jgi:acyl-CoA thioesterase-2
MSTRAPLPPGPAGLTGTLSELLELDHVDEDVFRAPFVFADPLPLYGGQVAAQALRAAGLTVAPDRLPHSLHGYYLRPGDASLPTILQVFRDRDGGSFSARRVVAMQSGKVIFNMAASFHLEEEGPDAHETALPRVSAPEASPGYDIPRLFAFEGRMVEQAGDYEWPMRFWARCTEDLGDDQLLHACALTYLSDISTGIVPFNTETHASSSSLDHAVWFHRPVDVNGWLLTDLAAHTVARGRGWYTGSVFTPDGSLVASLTQEALFRPRRPPRLDALESEYQQR